MVPVLLCSMKITLFYHVFILRDWFISFCIPTATFPVQYSQPFISTPHIHFPLRSFHHRAVSKQPPRYLSVVSQLLGTQTEPLRTALHTHLESDLTKTREKRSALLCYRAFPQSPAIPSTLLHCWALPLIFIPGALQSLNKAAHFILPSARCLTVWDLGAEARDKQVGLEWSHSLPLCQS